MAATPNTIGVLLLFLAIFAVCIWWACRGETPDNHRNEADYHRAIEDPH